MRMRILILAVACLAVFADLLRVSAPAAQANGQPSSDGKHTSEPERKPVVLSDRTTYRFEVQKVDAEGLLSIEKQWTFKNQFPPGLITDIKQHARLKKLDADLLRQAGADPEADSGFIRWSSKKNGQRSPVALLYFINGRKKKILGVSIDLTVDFTAGAPKKAAKTKNKTKTKTPAASRHRFDRLQLTTDVENTRLVSVRWGKTRLPKGGRADKADRGDKRDNVAIVETAEVNVTGQFTQRSSRAIRLADELLGGTLLQKLGILGLKNLQNESHHGITLGWLGYEHLQHNLFIISGKPKQPVQFRYRVSGTSFPLLVMRRQLADTGWPLVLVGHEYLGTSETGVRVFRPVAYVLERPQQADKTCLSRKTGRMNMPVHDKPRTRPPDQCFSLPHDSQPPRPKPQTRAPTPNDLRDLRH